MTCRLWRPRPSAAAIWPERNGSSPSVSAARPQSGVRRMLTVGPRRMLKPFATASSPTATPKRCASVVSHEAASTCAFGNAVRGWGPLRTPFGPSVGASGGMPSRGTPAPPLATSEIFSSRVIWARRAFACWRGVGRGAATPIEDAASAAPASTSSHRWVRFTHRGYAAGSFAVNQNCAGAGRATSSSARAARRSISLAGEVHPHLRRLVFDRVARDVHQGLLHRARERERCLVVGHHRRTGIGANAHTCRQAQRQRNGHGQVPAAHWRAVDEQRDGRRDALALRDVGLARRRKLETEDVVAFGNCAVLRLHLETL